MDPAGPYFSHNHTDKRLDPTDAQYVEAVHTDCHSPMSLGIAINVGHVDFYPNGCHDQPGCSTEGNGEMKSRITALIDRFACSHRRAPTLYSIDYQKLNKCRLIGYACESYEKFKKGECSDCGKNNRDCMIFEFSEKIPSVIRPGRSYFFDVGPKPPFCGKLC